MTARVEVWESFLEFFGHLHLSTSSMLGQCICNINADSNGMGIRLNLMPIPALILHMRCPSTEDVDKGSALCVLALHYLKAPGLHLVRRQRGSNLV